MYCVKCGVRLEDTERVCPLCATRVYHPDITREEADPIYPNVLRTEQKVKPRVLEVFVLVLFLIPAIVTLITDLRINSSLTWSLYVIGGLVASYAIFGLPLWFSKPNPVIFVPTSMAAITLYLLLIDILSGGGWFLGFALPIAGAVTLILSAVVTLLRYVRGSGLYVAGGAVMSVGALSVLIELLLVLHFGTELVFWSIYPTVVSLLLGGLCIFIAAYRPARELMERKFFF